LCSGLCILPYIPPRGSARCRYLCFSSRAHGCALRTLYTRWAVSGCLPAIIVVRDMGGHVFGGFAPDFESPSQHFSTVLFIASFTPALPWRTEVCCILSHQMPRLLQDPDTYVFTAKPDTIVYPSSLSNTYYFLPAPRFLAFGAGGEGGVRFVYLLLVRSCCSITFFGCCLHLRLYVITCIRCPCRHALWLDATLDRGSSGPSPSFSNPSLASTQDFKVGCVELWVLVGPGSPTLDIVL
jgi:TLD protein